MANKNNECSVWAGRLRVYVDDTADIDCVRNLVRDFIDEYLPTAEVEGLVSAQYLNTPGVDVDKGTGDSNAGRDGTTPLGTDKGILGAGSIVLFVFAGLVVVGAVGLVTWFQKSRAARRERQFTELLGNDTSLSLDDDLPKAPSLGQLDDSDYDYPSELYDDDVTGNDVTGNGALSPTFSSFMPAAYQFSYDETSVVGSSINMSTILEFEENSSTTPSILISDGWTTDEESMEVILNNSTGSGAFVLGARRRGVSDLKM